MICIPPESRGAAWVLLCAVGLLAACVGTRDAYRAAQTRPETALTDTAYVFAEHYAAVIAEARQIREMPTTPPSVITVLQQAAQRTAPVILGDPQATPPRPGLRELAKTYQSLRTPKSEAELQAAVNEAAVQLAAMVNAVKSARRSPQ